MQINWIGKCGWHYSNACLSHSICWSLWVAAMMLNWFRTHFQGTHIYIYVYIYVCVCMCDNYQTISIDISISIRFIFRFVIQPFYIFCIGFFRIWALHIDCIEAKLCYLMTCIVKRPACQVTHIYYMRWMASSLSQQCTQANNSTWIIYIYNIVALWHIYASDNLVQIGQGNGLVHVHIDGNGLVYIHDMGTMQLCHPGLGLSLLTLSWDKTWINNYDFQMQLLIGCQQSCQPIRSHIRISWLVNRDFILG